MNDAVNLIEEHAFAIACYMLMADVLDGRLVDFIEALDHDEAVRLGVKFYNGKTFNAHSDLRGDEQDDAKIRVLEIALIQAVKVYRAKVGE